MRSASVWFLPVVLTVASLAGCSVGPRDTRAAFEPTTDVSATSAMAQLPAAAGEVVSVLQSRLGGVLTQRIVLQGDPQTGGENQIVVKVDQNPRRPGDLDGPVPKPTESLIQAELDENFSAIDMRMSLTWNRNAFGPFGYAIGHAGKGVTCIYAWQWSAGRPPRIIDDPNAVASAASMPSEPTSVRVRLCRTGIGETEIVAMLRDLQVHPPGSAAAYADPSYESAGAPGARDALAAAGVGDYFLSPRAGALRSPHPHARSHAAHARRRRAFASRTFAPTAGPAPGSVAVPLPPGGAAESPAAVNPLLAPLQASAAPRPPATAADDMPLPARANNAARPASPQPAGPAIAPMPLPN